MGFNFQIQDAVREKIYPKIALMGASGSGKTYSALRLATGMKQELEERTKEPWIIVMANTEGSRGRYYANEFQYKIVDITEPHEPEKYVSLIEYVENLGNAILIIDSSSHEWEGKGGCLDLHRQAGGRYQDWGKVTPRHDKFINKIADSRLFLITTMRGKDQYVMIQEDNKKTKVEKVGLGAKQRDGFEYEFTCTFMLDQKTNMAEPFKDNTHLFDKEGMLILEEKHGKQIVQWADEGRVEASISPRVEQQQKNDSLKDLITQIDEIARKKAASNSQSVIDAVKKHHDVANYKTITDINVANKVLEELKSL